MIPHTLQGEASRILGLGLDILDPQELGRSLKSKGFRRQVFSPEELARHGEDLPTLAEAFALKEALVKAMGTGRVGGIEFFEVSWCPKAKPGTLSVVGGSQQVLHTLGVQGILCRVERRGAWVMGIVILNG